MTTSDRFPTGPAATLTVGSKPLANPGFPQRPPGAEADRNFIESLGRGLAVLSAFLDRRRPMTMAEVSRRTGLPRASVGRSLHTLAKLGYVAEDASHRFFLRPKVVAFAHAYLACSTMAQAAQPLLDRLSEELYVACSLAVPDDDHVVNLVRASTSRVLDPALNTGRRLPACYSAIGRVLLAFQPPEKLELYLERLKLVRYTPYTVASVPELRQILQQVRDQGFAAAERQVGEALAAIAVPVQDASGDVVAGIAVIAPVAQFPIAQLQQRCLEPLRATAQALRDAIG